MLLGTPIVNKYPEYHIINLDKLTYAGNLANLVISTDEAYGEEFFLETTKYNPHSPYSASKACSDHFVRAFHDT